MRAVPDAKTKADAELDNPSDSTLGALARDGVRSLDHAQHPRGIGPVLSSARHELRSPLQSIQGFAELLGSESYGTLSEEQHTFVQHILQGSLELGSVVEACLELAELELMGRSVERTPQDLRAAIEDALDPKRNGSDTKVQVRFDATTGGLRLRLERDALRRALHALLTALRTGQCNTFRAEVELSGEHVCLLLSRAEPKAPTLSSTLLDGLSLGSEGSDVLVPLEELATRRQAPRSLIWLRLSGALLAMQEAELRVTEQLDRAEVRFRLSSTH